MVTDQTTDRNFESLFNISPKKTVKSVNADTFSLFIRN